MYVDNAAMTRQQVSEVRRPSRRGGYTGGKNSRNYTTISVLDFVPWWMELGYEPILHPSNGQGDGLVSLQSGSYLSCLTSFIWCFRISGSWCWFYGIFANFSSKAWGSQGQSWFLSLWETLVRERLHNISMKLVERYDLLLAAGCWDHRSASLPYLESLFHSLFFPAQLFQVGEVYPLALKPNLQVGHKIQLYLFYRTEPNRTSEIDCSDEPVFFNRKKMASRIEKPVSSSVLHLPEKMDSICCFRPNQSCLRTSVLPAFCISSLSAVNRFRSTTSLRFGFPAAPFRRIPNSSFVTHAKKSKRKTSIVEPNPNKVEESLFQDEEEEEEEDELVLPEEMQDELLTDGEYDEDDDDFEFDESEEEEELYDGDGGGGGGIKLAGTLWDKEALALAESVCESFEGELGIYAFKTLPNSTIQVRIERLTSKFGSPTMEDIEAYSTIYRAKLAEAELAKSIPDNISLEVYLLVSKGW
ncbi:PREDICTED: uncharacterized protein LOC104702482 isoform X1 [Camelina sativa]|uniref:Uncharacterized protein LOC104702482 isoform X1 n=1 Tax=Camelina sativa TaxID=90675 RepID=A0ABM0SV90_CAMSA|nr:PREDICTED: uncharacterized protein LOC104702482 isoform X1 [Camelina sativa]